MNIMDTDNPEWRDARRAVAHIVAAHARAKNVPLAEVDVIGITNKVFLSYPDPAELAAELASGRHEVIVWVANHEIDLAGAYYAITATRRGLEATGCRLAPLPAAEMCDLIDTALASIGLPRDPATPYYVWPPEAFRPDPPPSFLH